MFVNDIDSLNLRVQAMRGIQRYMDIDPEYANNWALWVEGDDPDLQYESIWDYTVRFYQITFFFLCVLDYNYSFFANYLKAPWFFKAEMMNPASSGEDIRHWGQAVDALPLATALQRPIVIVFPHRGRDYTVHYRPGLSTAAVSLINY